MHPALLNVPSTADGAAITLLSTEGLTALLTLSLLEIVLGIDNVVFLAILTNKLEASRQKFARRLGLGLALVARILLLLGVGWLMTLTKPLFSLLGQGFSGKDLILLFGGFFLLAKATTEIYHQVEGAHAGAGGRPVHSAFGVVIAQIVAMDVIFSLDSVLTAVGMVAGRGGAAGDALLIMVLAVVLSMILMLVFAEPISAFISRHPSLKVLALAFLVMIGVLLMADGLGQHLPRGYVYAAMAFSLFVEILQMRAQAKAQAKARSEATATV